MVEPFKADRYPDSAGFSFFWPYSHEFLVEVGNKYTEIAAIAEISDDLTLLTVSPPEQGPAFGNYAHMINLHILWTGKDNGSLYSRNNSNYEKYIRPFEELAPPIKIGFNGPMPIHQFMSIYSFDFNHDPFRYPVGSITTSDFGLDNNYWEVVATELDERVLIPNLYTSLQFQAYGGGGTGSQFNRNVGLNHFPHRDMKVHLDDWTFFLVGDQEHVARAKRRPSCKNREVLAPEERA